MKLKKFQSEKAITLIALVVTIIVLIILAGISMNLILGENGIIKKAQGAEIQTALANVREQYGMYLQEYKLDNIEEDIDLDKDREKFTDLLQKVYVGEGNEYVYVIKNLSKLNVTDNSGKGEIPERVEEITELNDVYIVDKDNEVSYIVEETIYGNVETMIDLTVPTREDFFVIDEETGYISVVQDTSENHDGIGYYYSSETDKILSEEYVVIPKTINGIEVKGLDEYAFISAKNLKSVVIPEGVEVIGYRAFKNCTGLTEVTIPDGVLEIESYAFQNCTSLTKITIPNSVTSIESSVFRNCTSLASITISNSITSIENYTFYNCSSLTSITIPDSVTSIESSVFGGCTNLAEITMPDSVTSIERSSFDDTKWYSTQPEGEIYLGKILYKYKGTMPSGTSITIREGTKGITNYAFEGCTELTEITIPDSVISIGSYTFKDCTSLTTIIIPNSVTTIEWGVFGGCTSLTSITISSSVTSIGSYAFRDCTNLTTITIPDSVTSIGSYAFINCSNLTINCEATSKPSGWNSNWNKLNYSTAVVPVVWGYTQ